MESRADFQIANGTDVLRWFVSGAREVAAHIRYLNLINVYPVPDGDTGTNLSTTLRAMVEKPAPSPSFARMLQGLSQSGLESARGNSGIIFASYVNGLALESGTYERVTIREFSGIAFHAVRHLYEAVEHPVEGTMMSLIRDWAAYLNGNYPKYSGFQELFEAAHRVALASLEKTKTQLAALRRNNVVDSGAAGFVRFLEGINRVFTEGHAVKTAWIPELREDTETAPAILKADAPAYRYCIEALVNLAPSGLPDSPALASAVRGTLSPLGDSLVVTLRGQQMKTHIHTNTPELVMERLQACGVITEQKADDMLLQSLLRESAPGGIGLITDSIADIPDAYLLSHRVSVIPLGVLAHGTAYLDKITLRLSQLFRLMDSAEGYPTSSQPEPARIETLLASRLTQFDSLIALCVSGKLSNTWQAISQAAKKLETPEKRITVIDTRLNSGAQGLLVMRAVELAESGAAHDEIVEDIQDRIPRTKIYVCLNTLAYAVRGGRVPDTIGRVGMALGLRPIMTLDARGHGAAFGVAFSQAGLTRKIMRRVRHAAKHGGIEAYGIVHGDNPPLAAEYEAQLTRMLGQKPAFVAEISSAVALHAGPGTVAVSFTQGKGKTT